MSRYTPPFSGGTLTRDLILSGTGAGLPNAAWLRGRNAANTADINAIRVDGLDRVSLRNEAVVIAAASPQVTISTASGAAGLIVAPAAGSAASLGFFDGGTARWTWEKGTGNDFYLWNHAAAKPAITFAAGAALKTRINNGDPITSIATAPYRVLEVTDGTTAAPAGIGNSFHVHRRQSVTRAQIDAVQPGTDGSMALAAISGMSEGTTTDEGQPIGVYGLAVQYSTRAIAGPDAVGVYGLGITKGGATGVAFGGFFLGRNESTLGYAMGAEIHVEELGRELTYNASGHSGGNGIWLTTQSSFNTPAAILIGKGGANTGRFAYGIAVPGIVGGGSTGALRLAVIRDDGNADQVFDINGSHVDGLDMTGATFSGKALLLGNNQRLAWRNAANTASVDAIYLNTADVTVIASPAAIEGTSVPQLSLNGAGTAGARLNVNATNAQEAAVQLLNAGAPMWTLAKGGGNDFYLWNHAAGNAALRFGAGATMQVGFLGAAAVARQVVGAAATDAATTQTLANNLRAALINLGLAQA